MCAVPSSLLTNTENLTYAIRQNTRQDKTKGLNYYCDFIRGSLHEVLEKTFPLFSSQLSKQNKERYIEIFLRTHKTQDPEHHHIATEFVRLMQKQVDLSVHALSLLEYEWVLFSVEISPKIVFPQPILTIEIDFFISDAEIICNPTLICVELPFKLNGDNYTPNNEVVAYAIYRNSKHEILYKTLTPQEQRLMSKLSDSLSVSARNLLPAFSDCCSTASLASWLLRNHIDELISIMPLGVSHD